MATKAEMFVGFADAGQEYLENTAEQDVAGVVRGINNYFIGFPTAEETVAAGRKANAVGNYRIIKVTVEVVEEGRFDAN